MRNDRIMRRADMLHRYVRPFGGPLPSEAEVEAKIIAELRHKGIPIAHQPGSRAAFVNGSRWVIECDCGAGIACTPSLDTTLCPDCGSRYDVDWPTEGDQKRIEAALLARPAKLPRDVDPQGLTTTRCWVPEQRIEELEAETEALQSALAAREVI